MKTTERLQTNVEVWVARAVVAYEEGRSSYMWNCWFPETLRKTRIAFKYLKQKILWGLRQKRYQNFVQPVPSRKVIA